MMLILAMNWPLLAQESDSSDYFRWAIILFFVISSIVSAIGNMIKKKRGQLDDDFEDVEEDEDQVIILSDEIRPAVPPPPVARRARPPVASDAGETRPVMGAPVQAEMPRPPRPRPAADRPLPSRRALPTEKAKPRVPRRRVGTLVGDRGPVEHAKHIATSADGLGGRADGVGTINEMRTIASRSRQGRRRGLDMSRKGLRQAIVLNEILSPPLALRKPDDAQGL